MDGFNTVKQHFIVGVFASLLVGLLYSLGVPLAAAFARTSFLLLFLTLIIGPITKIKTPNKPKSVLLMPLAWRGELGIWFTITGLLHVVVLAFDRPITSFIEVGGSGYALANLLGLIALLMALVLSATSCTYAIRKLGVDSWKWIQNFAYVIFYLLVGHYLYFQFFSTYGDKPGPDWFGYTAVIMSLLVILLEVVAFVVVVRSEDVKGE